MNTDTDKDSDREVSVIRSVNRALMILQCFTVQEPELALGEISARTRIAKSTVHRLLQSLESRNFVEQNPENGKYCLSFELVRLGEAAVNAVDLRKVALPEMQWLVEQTKESSNLYGLRGEERICLAQADGAYFVKRYSEIGKLFPLYSGGGGKAILAFQEDAWIDHYLESVTLEATATNSPPGREAVWESLRQTRKNGWIYTCSERFEGACSIAAPIRDYTGKVIASLTVSAPSAQLPPDKVGSYLPLLLEATSRIGRRMGFRDNPDSMYEAQDRTAGGYSHPSRASKIQ